MAEMVLEKGPVLPLVGGAGLVGPCLFRHDFLGDFFFLVLVRADLKPDHLVTKRCPLLPWNSGVAAGVLVGPD